MLSTVLIIITLGHADAPHVSFSATESVEACAAKAEAITGVLKGAGYRIGAERCVETDLPLAAYDHAAKDFPHPYRITLPADVTQGGMIEPLDNLADCTAATDRNPAVWCAVSAQGVTAD